MSESYTKFTPNDSWMTSISDLSVLLCWAEAGAMARKAIVIVAVIKYSTCFIVKLLAGNYLLNFDHTTIVYCDACKYAAATLYVVI